MLLDAVPATYGAVVLTNGSGDPVGRAVALTARGGSDVSISRTLIRRAVHERAGLVWSIESGDPAFSDADSLMQSRARAVLCAPMLLGERIVGALYLATIAPDTCFEGTDLELAVGVANVAALALENAAVVEELESEAESLRHELNGTHTLVGRSPGMRAV
jgi:3',5'-cyclic-nucleotide phosphodiesterase